MNSQKIPFNYIENKIRSFKNDVDYTFTGEEYHAPSGNKDYNVNGYTQRTYQILSPQLQKTVQNYLTQQVAIFMQFEFEGRAYTMEWFRPDRVGRIEKKNIMLALTMKTAKFNLRLSGECHRRKRLFANNNLSR